MNRVGELVRQKQELLGGEKPPRAREAAKQLGITEAQYVGLSCCDTAVKLDMSQIKKIFVDLESLGEVMALTRNDQVVMEHNGIYSNPSFNGQHVIFSGSDIDLRLKIGVWQYGFGVNENGRKSLQFFDQFGTAAHKIYVTDKSDQLFYEKLVDDYRDEGCKKSLLKVDSKQTVEIKKSETLNEAVLRQEWRRLEDAHHVNKLLQLFGLTRPQAYQHLTEDAIPVKDEGLKALLTEASETELPLLMFAPNAVATQIHNGTVKKLMEMGPWFNVLDPAFNLHARTDQITEAWVVKKYLGKTVPTCSIEFFNDEQTAVMMVYLHPDVRNDELIEKKWHQLLANLTGQESIL